MRRKKYILVAIVFLSIVFYGFIKVSSTLPTFIKNKSNFKVYFSNKPFDLTFESKDYILYFNEKAINNIQKNMYSTFDNIVEWAQDKLKDSVDTVESKGGEVFRRFKKY